jgi:hypothetical protein
MAKYVDQPSNVFCPASCDTTGVGPSFSQGQYSKVTSDPCDSISKENAYR